MRYYKYDTQYLTYDVLHNELGYTKVPTEPVEWLSTGNSTYSWGDPVSHGYSYLLNDFTQCSNFAEGIIGWFDLNTIAITYSLYPSLATNLEFVKNNIYSFGVSLEFNDTTRFLIEKDIEQGWITEDEYLDLGWRIYEEEDPYYNYVVLDSETGDVLYQSKGQVLETVPIPACTIASTDIVSVPIPARVLESPEMVVYVPTVVDLPEVTEIWTLPNDSSGISTIQSGNASLLWGSTTPREQIPYDVTSCYAVVFWRKSDNTLGGRTEFSLEGISNVLAARNVSSSTIEVYWIKVAVCSSNQATVVPVYDSSNNAYNAFKYTTNSTDYYYVLDETQTDWTDDLSSIGYSLIPVSVLPTVSIDSNPVGSRTQTLNATDFTGPLHYMGQGGWSGDAIPYDTNKKYSLTTYNNGTSDGLQTCGIFIPISVSTQSGGPYYVGVKNISSASQSFMSVYVATCSSDLATVVSVYDSSNNAYNAFKFTANSTDYYYVLDETQTDWTDDLSSIGYSLEPEPEPDYLDIFFYYNAGTSDAGTSVTFAANDYWSTRIRNDSDKAALENFGVPIGTSDAGMRYVARTAVDSFTFTPIALYSGDGSGDLQADMSNFYCALRGGNPDPASLYYGVCIWSINAYSTNTQTWKCRITKINGGN